MQTATASWASPWPEGSVARTWLDSPSPGLLSSNTARSPLPVGAAVLASSISLMIPEEKSLGVSSTSPEGLTAL